MDRTVTVILKQDQAAPGKSRWKSAWDLTNEFVKSPLFGFVFGASFVALMPYIAESFKSADEKKLIRINENARSDAILVAPFISNLTVENPSKYAASKAALKALERATKTLKEDNERPVFVAVNSAIESVETKLRPPADKSELTPEKVKLINQDATQVPDAFGNISISYNQLKDALVYIQIDRGSVNQEGEASKLVKVLHENYIVAPGFEAIAKEKMPNRTQVRYFNDSDKSLAEALVNIMHAVLPTEQVFIARPKLTAQPGTLEVWFHAD